MTDFIDLEPRLNVECHWYKQDAKKALDALEIIWEEVHD